MPNWCFNKFHIDIEGGLSDALDVVKLLADDTSEEARERLAKANSGLREGEFPFEPLELVKPPAGMLDANPSDAAKHWRLQIYPESGSGEPMVEQLLHAILQREKSTPDPNDVLQADVSALNLVLFGHATRDDALQSKIGNLRASEGFARITQLEDGRYRVVAEIHTGWSPIGTLACTLLEVSEKIRQVRVFWIEQGNDFYGAALADRNGESLTLDEQGCSSGYEKACSALGLPEPQPDEGEDWVNVEFSLMVKWLDHRLDDLAQLRTPAPSPSP